MRVYLLTLKWFFIYLLSIVGFLIGLVCFVWAVKHLVALYGPEAIKGMVVFACIFGILLISAYCRAVAQIGTEKQEQNRILDSLRSDWD